MNKDLPLEIPVRINPAIDLSVIHLIIVEEISLYW